MMAQWFPNAYPVEMFQAVTSIAATLILFWAAYDAVKAAIGLPAKERYGARWTLAIGNVHRAFFRLLKSVVLGMAGGAALFLPPPPPVYRALVDSPEMRLGAVVVRTAIIVVTFLMLADASVERMFRQRYIRKLRMNGDDAAPRIPNDRRHPPEGERLS
jgi:hypothetical protein